MSNEQQYQSKRIRHRGMRVANGVRLIVVIGRRLRGAEQDLNPIGEDDIDLRHPERHSRPTWRKSKNAGR